MTIVALDVDFHKIYAVTDSGKVLAKAEPNRAALPPAIYDSLRPGGNIVLMEIASPVQYIRDIKVVYNVVKWALWNMSVATWLDGVYKDSASVKFLVAPSHVWTRGHALDVRHEVAKCTQKQKDLRECEAMIYYYNQDPTKWVPLAKYLEEL